MKFLKYSTLFIGIFTPFFLKENNVSLNSTSLYNEKVSPFSNLKFTSDTVNASKFGVKPDYNGKSGTDNRKSLQLAIDYCSKNKKILMLPKGRILLNSYGTEPHDKAHGNILNLKSNLTITGNNSELFIGNFFDDKSFIVFSAFNSVNPKKFRKIENICINNIKINFNAENSFMKNDYRLRKGMELGHVINAKIYNCILFNGDLSLGIGTGWINLNISKNVQIYNNQFLNLIKSTKNIDHTSVYINSQNSKVHHNFFKTTGNQGAIMACATEFHNSNNEFYKNKIVNYTRMMFLACTEIENHHIKNLKIYENSASITNAAIYLWLEKNTSIDNLLITKNNINSKHVEGYGKFHNGTQGLLADSREDENTKITNMTVSNNVIKISKTLISGRAVKYSTKYKFKDTNNKCEGCKDGVFYK